MSKATITAAQAHEAITREAKAKAVAEVRHIKAMTPGEVVRQGDIYIHCVDAEHPHGPKSKTHQLALGNTQGSRHVATGKVEVWDGTCAPAWARTVLLGPLVVGLERFVVTHPEHAHVSLPAGTYQVTHQLDPQTMDRVQD